MQFEIDNLTRNHTIFEIRNLKLQNNLTVTKYGNMNKIPYFVGVASYAFYNIVIIINFNYWPHTY